MTNRVKIANLKGPKGETGPQGPASAEGLLTNEAIAQNLSVPGEARDVLEASFADRLKVSEPTGDPENRLSPSAVHTALPPSGHPHNAFPAVAKLPDGRYLAAWRAGSSHSSLDGVACCSWYTPGQGWSPTVQIDTDEAGGDVRDVGLVVDGSTVVLTFYHRNASESVRQSYFKTSTDNGESWTPRTIIPFGFNGYAFMAAAMTVLPDGSWLAGCYGMNTGDTKQRIGVVKSTDKGASWSARVNLTGVGDFSEINMISTGGSNVLALIRTTPDAKWMLACSSADGGATWTAPVNAFMGEGNPHMTRMRDGVIVVTYRSLEQSWNGGSAYLAARTFDGVRWSDELLFGRATWWMVYADTIETDVDGELLCVWAAESTASASTVYATVLTSGATVSALGPTISPVAASSKIAKQYLRLALTAATVVVPAATWTPLSWGSQIVDYWNGWAPNAPNAITVNEGGLYQVHFQVRVITTVTTEAYVAIWRTGGGAPDEAIIQAPFPNGQTYGEIGGPVELAPGFDYQARVYFASGNTLSGTVNVARTRLTIAKLKGM